MVMQTENRFIDLKSINATLDTKDMIVYELDEFELPVLGSGTLIEDLDEEFFDSLTLEENELLMGVLG